MLSSGLKALGNVGPLFAKVEDKEKQFYRLERTPVTFLFG